MTLTYYASNMNDSDLREFLALVRKAHISAHEETRDLVHIDSLAAALSDLGDVDPRQGIRKDEEVEIIEHLTSYYDDDPELIRLLSDPERFKALRDLIISQIEDIGVDIDENAKNYSQNWTDSNIRHMKRLAALVSIGYWKYLWMRPETLESDEVSDEIKIRWTE